MSLPLSMPNLRRNLRISLQNANTRVGSELLLMELQNK